MATSQQNTPLTQQAALTFKAANDCGVDYREYTDEVEDGPQEALLIMKVWIDRRPFGIRCLFELPDGRRVRANVFRHIPTAAIYLSHDGQVDMKYAMICGRGVATFSHGPRGGIRLDHWDGPKINWS